MILKLFLKVRFEGAFKVFGQDFFVQSQSVFDFSDVFEVNSIGDAQTFHLVSVAPLLEMLFEGTTTPVASSSTDLTLEFFAKSV